MKVNFAHGARPRRTGGSVVRCWPLVVALPFVAPVLAQDEPRGYLGDSARDLAAAIGPPPTAGSPAALADRAKFRASIAGVGSAEWNRAAADAVEGPAIIARMECASGRMLDQTTAPSAMTLLIKAQVDLSVPLRGLKLRYNRPRPYVGDDPSTPICEPVTPEARSLGQSYPSGHAAEAALDGYILASLLPDRAMTILMRGFQYGDERVACRVHNLSDVEAGQRLAAIVFRKLQGDARFRHDMVRARQEVARSPATRLSCAIRLPDETSSIGMPKSPRKN